VRTDAAPALSETEEAWEAGQPSASGGSKLIDGSICSFPQGGAQRPGDPSPIDRLALGGQRRLGQGVRLTGEVSVGDGGVGALAKGSYAVNDRMQLYTNSGVDAKPIESVTPGLNGALTSGVRWRVSKTAGVFGEERLKIADGQRGGAHAVGFELNPAPHWTSGMVLEMGELRDPSAGIRHQRGGSLSVAYARKGLRYGGGLELHLEEGEGPVRGEAWSARNDFELQVAGAWRLLSHLNASLCSAHVDSSFEGTRIECWTELAHKRTGQDGFNLLTKYTFFLDRAQEWQSDLQVGLFSPVNEITQVGVGYNFDHFPNSMAGSSSEGRGWFLEIAGTF
jgi:hypothetical protein